MSPIEELVMEQKLDRIGELLEQLALDAVVTALENIIERNELYESQTPQNEDLRF